MHISVYPQTKLLAALVAAGVVAAGAPLVTSPSRPAMPAIYTAEIQPASFITDALSDAAIVVGAVTLAVNGTVDTIAELPVNSLALFSTALLNPGAIGSLLSFAVQSTFNPEYNAPVYGFYGSTLRLVLLNLASALLPAPLNSLAQGAIVDTSVAIGNLFAGLPDPSVGDALIEDAVYRTDVGRVLLSITKAITGPVHMVTSAVEDLAWVPYNVEASIENVFQDPADFPGLFGFLARDVVYGVVGAAYQLVEFGISLPAPIGSSSIGRSSFVTDGIAWNALNDFYTGVANVVDLLVPPSVTPQPAAAVSAARTPATSSGTEPPAVSSSGKGIARHRVPLRGHPGASDKANVKADASKPGVKQSTGHSARPGRVG
ncbi:hypothetical protein [Mycolicibacterium vinylchloridicum]|uniref:hypothetical protein n=1 Tax=Mycolicibacterium vinylchloridicum TaxID=2736928 RepID=UPI0015CB492D|nr:hypothetical protein [Mycolicibacterium vinylchloridicum]